MTQSSGDGHGHGMRKLIVPGDNRDEANGSDALLPAGSSTIANGTSTNTTSKGTSSSSVTWPADTVPVEIFQIILSHLTRKDIKDVRLVCQEFEEKAAGPFFRNVLVPFTAHIFTEHGRSDDSDKKMIRTKLSEGMRIFQSFGSHIKHFGLSLELDEAILAFPPVKPLQTAVSTFWGIYRWPNEAYTRYNQVQNIEDTADELASLREALRYLTNVQELALCCDPGLGYLNGPERIAGFCPGPQPVFGLRNPRYTDLQADARKTTDWKPLQACKTTKSDNRAIIRSMMLSAGTPASKVDEYIKLLLQTEGVKLAEMTGLSLEGSCKTPDEEPKPGWPADSQTIPQVVDNERRRFPLVPTRLTQAQHELLVELDWAHRALTESYILAIGDLGRAGHFAKLTKLTIAKISNSHLIRLKHDDLWDSLPALDEVSLAVQPDWRSLSEDPSDPGNTAVCPLKAVPGVYELLNNFLGRKKKIKTLHFEWVCGGEFAVGSNSRDRFILPAPLCLPEDMVSLDVAQHPAKYISLPHVEHLSLKNCYATPHLFMQVVRKMSLQNLAKLELEGFSLTGAPEPRVYVPPPAPARHNDQHLPTLFTLAGFIEHFAPGSGLLDDDTKYDRQSVDHFYTKTSTLLLGDPPLWKERINRRYKLKTLSFKSCGYVAIDCGEIEDPTAMSRWRGGGAPYNVTGRLPVRYLQTTHAPLAGSIAHDVAEAEKQLLVDDFGMSYGWSGIYDEWFSRAAMNDLGVGAGVGRVSGTLERGSTKNTKAPC